MGGEDAPLELVPAILITAIAIAAGIALRRAHLGSTGSWGWAWAALFASALSFQLVGQLPGAVFLSPLFGTLFAVFLLLGAIHVVGRSPPRWLLPAGLGAGALRGALELLGASEVSGLLALLLEPAAELASELASDFCYEVRVDARGRYSEGWVTGAFERITGYTPREVEALGLNFVHPEDQELVKARL